MPAEKRNQFLDADESDDDVGGYESEEDIHKGGRSAKRRKVQDDDLSDSEDDEAAVDVNDDSESGADGEDGKNQDGEVRTESEEEAEAEKKKPKKPAELPSLSRPLLKKNLVVSEKAIKKSGVVYLQRIPPFMKVEKLRSLLEPYGQINRIFLVAEDPIEHARRVRNGGNKKKLFTEGWVEFVNKKDAKKAVDLLNAKTIGGKKGSYYRDDVWSLKYLNGYKWHNLTEQISAEAAERSSRMRAEIAKANKENKEFAQNVERSKMVDGIQSKRKRKQGEDSSVETKNIRKFEQAAPIQKQGAVEKLPEDALRVGGMLLG